MSRVFTPIDGSAILNAVGRQITGKEDFTQVNAGNYASVGETVLQYGVENVYNALGIVLGRTLIAVRPTEAKLKIIQAMNSGMYTSRLRKISYYSQESKQSGFFNTDLLTNLAPGFTNGQNPDSNDDPQSAKSMWEQCPGMPLEMNFGGTTVWDYGITMYEDQDARPFRSAEEMSRFVSGILMQHANDIEIGKEAWNRLALLTHIGKTYNAGQTFPKMRINMTAAFNARYGTSYTSEELRTTYLKEFLAFLVVTVKQTRKYLAETPNVYYHNPMVKTVGANNYYILRQTKQSDQKLILYSPLFEEAEAMVLPEIFHDEELRIGDNYEEVTYWQAISNRPAVDVTVATRNVDGTQNNTGTRVQIPYVIGILFDRDALVTDFQLERALTTPIEARKGYRTTWLHIARNIISDDTENSVVFYMEDED